MVRIVCIVRGIHGQCQPVLLQRRNNIGSKLEPPPDMDFRRSISASSTSKDVMADVVCELREHSAHFNAMKLSRRACQVYVRYYIY